MQFDKRQIIDLLQSHGHYGKAQQADEQLPDKVDTDQHSGRLEKIGLRPQDLMSKLADGGLGGLLSR